MNKTPETDEAYGYLSRLFTRLAPQCEPLPTLPGLATQLDNYIAGLRNLLQEGGCSVCGQTPAVNVNGTYWLCGPCVFERLITCQHCGNITTLGNE